MPHPPTISRAARNTAGTVSVVQLSMFDTGPQIPPAIVSFRGPHRFLSNFFEAVTVLDGVSFPTLEHAFVAAKVTDPVLRAEVLDCDTPGAAKRWGRRQVLRPGWDEMRVDVMRALLASKFSDPSLAARLRATAPAQLVEGNNWHDTFWGVCAGCSRGCDRVGENWLGRLLVELRSSL